MDEMKVRAGDELSMPIAPVRMAKARRARRCQSCQEVDCLDDPRALRTCECRCHWSRG